MSNTTTKTDPEVPDLHESANTQFIVPSLVVNGNNDIMFPTINSYNLFQHLPNARLSLYPDSGHGAIYQYADSFVKEAADFLGTD